MLRALALAVLLGCAGASRGDAPLAPLPGPEGVARIGLHVELLEDPAGALSLEQVRRAETAARFVRSRSATPNFGYTRSAWWLRFRLPAASRPGEELLLEVRFPSIDRLDFFAPQGAGWRQMRAGDTLPWDAREVKRRSHVFRFTLPQSPGTHEFYLRASSAGVLTVPLHLWRPEPFERSDRQTQLLLGLFYGLVAALALYNAMLYFSVRDRAYLYYVAYAAAFGTFLLAFDGLAFEYLWPESVWWANHGLATALALTLAFGTLFASRFLDMARTAPRGRRLMQLLSGSGAVLAILAASGWLLEYGVILRTLSVLGLAAAAVAIYVGVRALALGYRPARFFLLAWGALLAFIALGALRNFALVPSTFATVYGLHIGFALDVLLLSFALADRINSLELATAAAQAEVRERDRRVERLRHMAQHDSLTGLPNRVSMQQRLALAIELAKRNRKKLAVMMVDLDGFKRLNDERGHIFGDHALSSIAGRLRTSVRGSDTVARYGGDEFVVLAGELDRGEDVGYIAEKIADMVSLPLAVDGVTERVTCSIGISLYPDDARDGEALIERADRAMYAAKNAKIPQRYAFFSAA
ncbi:MAG: GGDEF domain-containing protein [Betaproteobacteria bacterium]|nr:GGDEF domain-containing protein [Betaproteobacteria bacterium]